MNTTLAIEKYLKTDVAKTVSAELEAMVDNPVYKTDSSYTPSSEDRISFVNKHLRYLSTHQKLNYQQYLSNLKLMTKIK
jgi:hypothetical protein